MFALPKTQFEGDTLLQLSSPHHACRSSVGERGLREDRELLWNRLGLSLMCMWEQQILHGAAEEHSPLFIPVVSNCWSKQEEMRSLVFCSCECRCCVVSKWFLLSSTNVAREGSKCCICIAKDAVPAHICSEARMLCLFVSLCFQESPCKDLTYLKYHCECERSDFPPKMGLSAPF